MINFVCKDPAESAWEKPDGMKELLYRVLRARGISSDDEARKYLHPDLSDLLDPFLLNDMRCAVDILRMAVEKHQKIVIYGDYDVDGVCSSATMYRHLKSLGADADVYLPNRYDEGYGLNENAIRKLAEAGCEVLLTVDCGITHRKEIALAKELGIIPIVTDHHTPSDELPECPVVNPLLNGYPFPYLCGAGVAFKTVAAMSGMDAALRYIEFTALATIADIVSLTGENRIIAYYGLQRINQSRYAGIDALRRAAGIDTIPVTSDRVAFGLAPRINACGRMASATEALRMLITDDPVEAQKYAEIAENMNVYRKTETVRVQTGIEKQMQQFSFSKHRAIVLEGEDCPGGIAGLVASKLTEIYGMPSIVLSANGEYLVGSCRSIPGINIHDALKACEKLLVRYGGHSQAAGLTLRREDLPELIEMLDAYLTETAAPELYIPETEYDAEISLDELTVEGIASLAAVEPTGKDNPPPRILIHATPMYPQVMGADSSHLRMVANDGKNTLKLAWFHHGFMRDSLPDEAEFVIEPQNNEYTGRATPQGIVQAMKPIQQNVPHERCFLTDILYNYNDLYPIVTADEVRETMKNCIFGTLVVCETAEAVNAVKRLLDGMPFDTALNGENPYPYNAVALRPSDETIRRYENVIVLSGETGITGKLFDKDGFREILIALRRLLQDGARSMDICVAEASRAAGCGEKAAAAAIKALAGMRLLSVSEDSVSLPADPPKRAYPEINDIYKAISYIDHFQQSAKEETACRIRAMYVQA